MPLILQPAMTFSRLYQQAMRVRRRSIIPSSSANLCLSLSSHSRWQKLGVTGQRSSYSLGSEPFMEPKKGEAELCLNHSSRNDYLTLGAASVRRSLSTYSSKYSGKCERKPCHLTASRCCGWIKPGGAAAAVGRRSIVMSSTQSCRKNKREPCLLTSSSHCGRLRSGIAAAAGEQRSIFTHKKESYVKLKEKVFQVNPGFGVLHATGTIDFCIKPTNVQEYPDADRAFITLFGLASESCEGVMMEVTGEQRDTLTVSASPHSSHVYCEVSVPIKYDLDVTLMDEARLRISQMESDEVRVNTEFGEVSTGALKTHNLHITTRHGHITADGPLQGNIFIRAKKTHLKAKRLQGSVLDMEAEELNAEVESSYMSQGQIKADSGTLRLNNLHGCTDLLLKEGKLVINGFHGQIAGFVGSGQAEVQVTDVTGHSTLHLRDGDMKLSIQEQPRHDLEVVAPLVKLSEEVRECGSFTTSDDPTHFTITTHNPDACSLRASVNNGSMQVECKSWFSTLGIRLPEK